MLQHRGRRLRVHVLLGSTLISHASFSGQSLWKRKLRASQMSFFSHRHYSSVHYSPQPHTGLLRDLCGREKCHLLPLVAASDRCLFLTVCRPRFPPGQCWCRSSPSMMRRCAPFLVPQSVGSLSLFPHGLAQPLQSVLCLSSAPLYLT